VWLQKWIYKDIYLKEIGRHAQNMINILNSIVRKGGGGGLGGGGMPICSINEGKNLQFHIAKKNIHKNSKFCQGSGYNLDLDIRYMRLNHAPWLLIGNTIALIWWVNNTC